jgi:hypothetical protein
MTPAAYLFVPAAPARVALSYLAFEQRKRTALHEPTTWGYGS